MSVHRKESKNEYQLAILNLKKLMKERQLTYKELSKGIGLSESGVKKIFSSKDGSFQRLVTICQYVGISIAELIENHRTVDVGFTDKQQSEFLIDPLLFKFYWLLTYERLPIQNVQRELELNKAQSFRLARKLDVLGLIKLLPGDRIRLPSIKAVRWTGEGEFLRLLYHDWSQAMVKNLAKPKSQNGELFIIRYLQMTQKTYFEFIAAQRAIENEFVRRSIQEMRVKASGLEHVRWMTLADNRSFATGGRLADNLKLGDEK